MGWNRRSLVCFISERSAKNQCIDTAHIASAISAITRFRFFGNLPAVSVWLCRYPFPRGVTYRFQQIRGSIRALRLWNAYAWPTCICLFLTCGFNNPEEKILRTFLCMNALQKCKKMRHLLYMVSQYVRDYVYSPSSILTASALIDSASNVGLLPLIGGHYETVLRYVMTYLCMLFTIVFQTRIACCWLFYCS